MMELPPVTMADVLAREAGPPHHEWTHEDAMDLALETGWHIEPLIEAEDAAICPAQWHVRADWHTYCDWLLAEDPKRPTYPLGEETWALLGWPVGGYGGGGWVYPPSHGSLGYAGGSGGRVAGYSGGGSGSSDDDDRREIPEREIMGREFREFVRTDTFSTAPPLIIRVPGECCGGGCLWCPTPPDHEPDPEPSPVPLPGSVWLLGAAMLGLFRRWRK